jgi:DNA-binding LytR/AlgR family response regulator
MVPIVIRGKGQHPVVHGCDLICIKAAGRYCNLFLKDSSNTKTGFSITLACTNLKEFEKLLPAEQFQRVRRSMIVNIDSVKSIGPTSLTLHYELGFSVPVSKPYRAQLKSKFLVIK